MTTQTRPSASASSFESNSSGYLLLSTTAFYGLYAFFLLTEVLSFLSVLHSPPPGVSPTYSIVNVAFYMVDMIVCASFAFAFLLMRLNGRRGWILVVACLSLTAVRLGLVYYLYIHTTPDYRWVPFIYKNGTSFSDAARIIFLPLQILFGFASAFFCRPHATE